MPTHADGNAVTHPPHYNWHPGGIECREVVRAFNFNKGNAIKYLWRAGHKGGPVEELEDLRKAADYIQDEIERVEAASAAEAAAELDPDGPDRCSWRSWRSNWQRCQKLVGHTSPHRFPA